jgi:hypothetical protein
MYSSVVVVALVAGCGILIAGVVLVAWAIGQNRRPPSP